MLALCAIVAPSALAGSIDAAFLGTQQGLNVKVNLSGGVRDVFSGQITYALSNGTDECADLSGTFVTFCSELTEFVSGSTLGYSCVEIPATPFDNASPFSVERTQAVANLLAAYGDTAISTTDATFASAFQITVWELIYDFNPGTGVSSIDPTSGSLIVTNTDTSSLASGVSSYISTFAAAAMTSGSQNALFSIRNSGAQDQILLIPAPGSVALLGLAGLATLRRRR